VGCGSWGVRVRGCQAACRECGTFRPAIRGSPAGAGCWRGITRTRAKAEIAEVEGSHVIMISQPQAVTDIIMKALQTVA
jgi:hypothetical protein